jgi:hypothetical protein
MTFTERARTYPPILVRLLARDGSYGRPLYLHEISSRAGLGPEWIITLSERTTWNEVPFYTMLAFLRGCDLSFEDRLVTRRMDDYIVKGPTFKYLRSSDYWRDLYKPMMINWRKSYGIVMPDTPNIWPPLRRLLIRLNPLLKQ